jgi:hypothetical protein
VAVKCLIVAAAIWAIIAAAALFVWRAALAVEVLDTVHVAAASALRDLDANPGADVPQLVKSALVENERASVSWLWYDDAGAPVDAWETPFQVTVDAARPAAWLRCASAGPDRRFGTDDDISYTAERP